MSVVLVVLLLVSVVITLFLWLAISQETSNPTVVDRAEAERIAKERGGRGPSQSVDGSKRIGGGDDHAADGRDRREGTDRNDGRTGFDRHTRDEYDERDEWGSDDGWGNRRP